MSIPPPDIERTAVVRDPWLPGYELVASIGRGGCGEVFKARQLSLGREVAVKVVRLGQADDPTAAERFATEAAVLGRLRHPNVVSLYEFGRHDGTLFLVMELVEGEDLGQRLRRAGPLAERTAWLIARQAAAGLAHAAALGVVHRDVKPGNLCLTDPPAGAGLPAGVPLVKVTDFGLARVAWAVDAADRPRTAPGVSLGTPGYMAPEQYRGGPVDHRADVYALGATVYHALAGRPPFEGRTVWDVMARKLENTPPPLPDASPEGAALISAMMATNPAARVGSYDELLDRIDRLPVLLDRPPPAPPRPARRRWWPVAALTGAAAAGAGAILTPGLWRPPPATLRADGPPAHVTVGEPESLFDGASLDRWATSGTWAVGRDEEGTPVLTGSGHVRRAFGPTPDYQLVLGLDVYEAAAAEVEFAVRPDGRRLVLRVARDEGATLGTRAADRDHPRPLAGPVPFPGGNWFKGRRPYLEVRIERAGDWWSAYFRGTLVGRVQDAAPTAPAFRLTAHDGQVRADTVLLTRIGPKPTTGGQ